MALDGFTKKIEQIYLKILERDFKTILVECVYPLN